jgi:hypothetical protein
MTFSESPKTKRCQENEKETEQRKLARERASRPEICLKTRPHEELGRWW